MQRQTEKDRETSRESKGETGRSVWQKKKKRWKGGPKTGTMMMAETQQPKRGRNRLRGRVRGRHRDTGPGLDERNRTRRKVHADKERSRVTDCNTVKERQNERQEVETTTHR